MRRAGGARACSGLRQGLPGRDLGTDPRPAGPGGIRRRRRQRRGGEPGGTSATDSGRRGGPVAGLEGPGRRRGADSAAALRQPAGDPVDPFHLGARLRRPGTHAGRHLAGAAGARDGGPGLRLDRGDADPGRKGGTAHQGNAAPLSPAAGRGVQDQPYPVGSGAGRGQDSLGHRPGTLAGGKVGGTRGEGLRRASGGTGEQPDRAAMPPPAPGTGLRSPMGPRPIGPG